MRQYRHLGFADLHADQRSVPLAHAGGVPHRVLVFDSMTAERHWHAAKNGLCVFMIETLHPDIDLFAPAAPALATTMPPALSLIAA